MAKQECLAGKNANLQSGFMDRKQRLQRITELMGPIDYQIMMCDNEQDLVLMASAMLASAKHILNVNIGREEMIKVFEEVMYND